MTNAEILGNKLYELRRQAGLSQEEFAEKIGVSRQAVSKWERGEALPDTDNLITIARMYKISLDELIANEMEKSTEKTEQSTFEDNEDSKKSNVNVKIGRDGIYANVSDEDSNVRVKIGGAKFSVDIDEGDDDDDDDEGDEDIYYSYDGTPADKKRKFLRVLHALPYPIMVTIAFLLWGFLAKDASGWTVGWTLFITIPVYYSVIDCFRTKRLSNFCYPVFIAFLYCLFGMLWGLWHPLWIMFITIPVYYVIADAIDKKS